MRTLVCGLGSIGLRHARNLRALGISKIVGVDPSHERRERFTTELSQPAYEHLDRGLKTGIDLALICSPNVFHVSQAIACAEANCHLFIEKPIGVTKDGLDALIDLVETKRLFAHVGSNWKFHAAFRAMKTLLADGAIGTVTCAQVLAGQWLPDWHPWEDYRRGYSARRDLGGGVVFDTHEFDYLTWLLGPVSNVKGFTARSGALDIETDDIACACLQFECGALATLQIDYIQRQTRRRYHISGDRGTIEWDIHDGRVRHFRAGDANPIDIATPMGDVNEMYVEQMRDVLDAVENGRPPVTSLRQAASVFEIQWSLAHGNA